MKKFFKRHVLPALAVCILHSALCVSHAQVVDQTYTNLAGNPAFEYLVPGSSNVLAPVTNVFPTNASSAAGQVSVLIGTNSAGTVNTGGTNMILDIRHFDEVDLQISFTLQNPNGGSVASGGTNNYAFGVSDDGIHFTPTNTPLFTISVSPPVGQSNAVVRTNLARSFLGSAGFLQLQYIDNWSTNGITNHVISAWGKGQRAGTTTPVF